MADIKKLLKLDTAKYFEVHLSIINCILPKKMTPKEIEIMSAFMSLDGSITDYRFGTSGRKIIMKNLELSASSMSNHLKSLLDKGFLYEVEGTTKMLELLLPNKIEQMYTIKLINNGTIV